MHKKRVLSVIIITAALFASCNNTESFYDPINGHEDIIRSKIEPGNRIVFLGDSVTDEREQNKKGLGSWVDWFAEFSKTSSNNLAMCESTYSLYKRNVCGISIKYGYFEKVNLDDYDYIIITGGVNNILGIDDVATSFRDMDYTCRKVSKYSKKVILCNPFYFFGEVNDMTPAEAALFRQRIYENAVKYGFSYVDLTKFQYERADEIHPTPLGCVQIALQMFNRLVK